MNYVVGGFFVNTIGFVLVVTLVSLGTGLAVTPLAVPVMIVAFATARGFADVERRRVGSVTGVPIPRPRYLPGRGLWWSRLKAMLADPATYRDVSYCGLAMFLSIVTLVLVVTLWATTLGLLTAPLWMPTIPGGATLLPDNMDGVDLFGNGDLWFEGGWTVTTFRQGLSVVPLALVTFPLTIWVTRHSARKQIRFAQALLAPSRSEQLRERVDALTATRADALQAQSAELRRIERDLHDGAQSHLVALAMDLGMARDKLDDDPEAARALVGQAHEEAKRTLAELRNLARGIAPAVLTDRGLRAALAAVAGRCPVPVVVDTDELPADARLTVDVETAAYFVVSEALTNVAKHSRANTATVRVALYRTKTGGSLVVEVRDDGVGGIDPSHGSGVAGLHARVAALDGDVTVTSPAGGPTVLRATVPVPVPPDS